MSYYNLIKFSFRELFRYRSLTLFMILNLTIGLFGFFILQIFQQSLNIQSAEKAQIIQGGDITISARKAFTEAEVKSWEAELPYVKKSHQFRLFSMLRSSNETKLANIIVFDENYPLYGDYKFSGEKSFSSDQPYIWIDPEIQDFLNLKVNDTVEVGEMKFLFAGVLTEDPSRLFGGMSFAPQAYIPKKYLAKTALLKPGSTFTETWFYKVAATEDPLKIKEKINSKMNDPFVYVRSVKDRSDNANSNRVLQYFTDYLGLVALVALGLCFLCSSYLLSWVFLSKKKTIAIYKTLGLSDTKIISSYLIQNFIISATACALGIVMAHLLLPFLQALLVKKFNLPLQLIISNKALILTALIAVLGPLLIIIPQVAQIMNLKPLMLFQNTEVKDFKRKSTYFFWMILLISAFWYLTLTQSHSYRLATIFTGSSVFLILLFRFLNNFILLGLEKISIYFSWSIRYAIKGLTRKKSAAGLVFTTMSLSMLILSLLPHIKSSIINEVRPEESRQMPALFMFDIQPEQREPLKALAQKLMKQELNFSPLVRSRILKVNDQSYERNLNFDEVRTREAEEEARFRNRGINLTYRGRLQDSEQTIQGSFSGLFKSDNDNNEIPQISIEKRYADRMGLSLGDKINFDIQGVEVKAQVGSFRRVRWTSFQPNFFILFPNGVIEEAPQMFLTSLMLGEQPEAAQNLKELQLQASNRFSNISIIDVRRTVENSLKYVDQMSLGLEFMAWLAVILGILVFVILLNTQIKERLQEMNLLQILGAGESRILKIVLTQFILLFTISILFGVLLGFIVAWILVSYVFDIKTVYDSAYLVGLGLVLIPVCAAALYYGLQPLKKLNPMDLIRQS